MSNKSSGKPNTNAIDYSKWDRLDYGSDSDDPKEEVEEENRKAQVLRLDAPSSVTFQPSDETWAIYPTPTPSPAQTIPTTTTPHSSNSSKDIDSLTKNGSDFFDSTHQVQTYWCQDRYQGILSISFDSKLMPPSAIRVQATGLVSYSNRFSAVGTLQDKGTLRIYHNEHTILQGTLPYFVHYPEEDDDDEEEESIDWEITPDPYSLLTNPHTTMRLIRITFNKAVPMVGLIVWWTKPLMHFPDIDLKDIESRTTANTNTSNRMREAWEEAHRLFQENIKNKDKISI